ncbi:MAG TPA: M20/M25/M40 family metallo-hydrolase [Candidatus Acidoferrales bacterium]|nr:M20/M25/M40 family metallo-hydrolase [Candidatus Acidoferrales bacterium]
MRKPYLYLAAAGIFAALPIAAQAPSVSEMYAQIRAEETSNSKIMWIIHEVADVHGPRVTGSPTLKEAQDWAVKTLTSWGLTNAHLEPWTFQPPSAMTPVPGWENIELEADVLSPFHGQLMVKPLAWTPSTKGLQTSDVVQITPPGLNAGFAGAGRGGRGVVDAAPAAAPAGMAPPMPQAAPPAPPAQPTRAELDAYLNSVRDKIRGRIVMVGKHVEVAENFNPAPLRRTDQEWALQFDPNNPNAGGRRGGGGGGGRGTLPEGQLTAAQVNRVVDDFLVANGAIARINDAGRAYGVIVAQQNNTYDWTRMVPTLVMRNEDYGRIARTLADGAPVKIRINVLNKEYPEGTKVYNVVAEIPGTDKASEVVMLGGHYDSWHDATGATDNGIGSSMMLEAVRLLTAVHAKPRRTIRIALWSGEEEGLLGSIAYVAEHFGTAENPKPNFAKLDCYFNIDSGTSKPRGASVFGPAEAAAMIRDALMPYKDWGFNGANPTTSRNLGGTDSTTFNNAGLPGVGLSQDPFDYNTFTHHTNLDTYERIYEEDVREGAVEIASAVYAVAMADNMVPRFQAAQMPAPVHIETPGETAIPPGEITPRNGGRRGGN